MDRMGSLQYKYEWNHGHEKEPSLQCGPKLLNGGQASCCGALEGQSSPEKDQGTAGYISQEPRGVHAEEAGGCYPERGQLHQVLASM
jgi:hypothetical protein